MALTLADVKKDVLAAAPAACKLAEMFGGPYGAMAGALVSRALSCGDSPDAISAAIKGNPQSAIQLMQLENDEKLQLAQINEQATAAQIAAVNGQMGEETRDKAEQGWRKFCGYTVAYGTAVTVIVNVVVVIASSWLPRDVNLIAQLPLINASMAALLVPAGAAVGIVAWHSGQKTEE